MKLFELFESPIIGGANNLRAIANAATSGAEAHITLGNEPVTLEYPEARFVYGLYKRALQNGQQEQFLKALTDPVSFDKMMSTMRGMLYRDRGPEMAQAAADRIGQPGVQEAAGMPMTENTDTLKHIVNRFKHEVKNFLNGHDLDTDLYHALFDYYSDHGEMPYGTQKARDGDPYEWVTMRFDRDVHDYVTESTYFEGEYIFEALDMNLLKSAQGAMKKNAKDPESERNVGKKYGYRSDKVSDDDDNYDEWGNEKPGKKKRVAPAAEPTEKRGRGRPRTRPEPDANAPKRGRGRPRKNPLPDPNAPKRGRGRPKKVREWIETLRFVAEGFKNASK